MRQNTAHLDILSDNSVITQSYRPECPEVQILLYFASCTASIFKDLWYLNGGHKKVGAQKTSNYLTHGNLMSFDAHAWPIHYSKLLIFENNLTSSA